MEKKHQKWLGLVLAGGMLLLVSFDSALASPVTGKNVINLVNQERLAAGLNSLTENFQLNEAALAKLEDMTRDHYFAHTSPDGASPWFWFDQAGYDYRFAGENLAINFHQAEDQHRSWMASAEHRKNILNPNYQEIGVAVGEGEVEGKKTLVTVQLFGTRQGSTAVLGQSSGNIPKATEESDFDIRIGSFTKGLAGGIRNGMAFLKAERQVDIYKNAALLLLFLAAVSGPLVLAGNSTLKAVREIRGMVLGIALNK